DAEKEREQRADQEEDEGLGKHRRAKVAAGDDEGRAEEAHHSSLLLAHRRGRRASRDRDEGIMKARTFDRQCLDTGAAVDQRPKQRLGTRGWKLEHPFIAYAASACRDGRPPRAVARAGAEANDRTQLRSGIVDATVERDLPL